MTIPQAAIFDPQTAPWLCTPCGRGFWVAECSEEARAAYRPQFHDWGYGASALRAAVRQECAEALRRKTSVHPDLEPLLDDDARMLLVRRRT